MTKTQKQQSAKDKAAHAAKLEAQAAGAPAGGRTLKAKARAKGFTLTFAPITAISKDGVTRRGRRAAILVKGPAVPKVLTNDNDPTCLALLSTGRWLELLIPIGDGKASFICTCAYGYSGQDCEIRHDCDFEPCANDGTCHDGCPDGFAEVGNGRFNRVCDGTGLACTEHVDSCRFCTDDRSA